MATGQGKGKDHKANTKACDQQAVELSSKPSSRAPATKHVKMHATQRTVHKTATNPTSFQDPTVKKVLQHQQPECDYSI